MNQRAPKSNCPAQEAKCLRLPENMNDIVEPALLKKPDDLTVACFTFPGFHKSALAEKIFGPGWDEYILMRGCRPWFQGHHQPRQPLLGELDEALPETWALYNRLAVEHGIDVFIWDAYWYGDEPAMHEALDNGFLRSANCRDLKFAVMWTNHSWPAWFPNVETDNRGYIEYLFPPPDTTPETVWRSMTYLISRYFHLPNYWRVNGKPVLVIWAVDSLVKLIGKGKLKHFFEELSQFAVKAGHKGLHIHCVGEYPAGNDMGIDTCGNYNPVTVAARRMQADSAGSNNMCCDYGEVAAQVVREYWQRNCSGDSVPFLPAVSPGFDTSPRRMPRTPAMDAPQGVWASAETIVMNETPAAFKAMIQGAFAYLNKNPNVPRIMTIACWNEWTEGHYLLPDTRLGFGMLRALAEALGTPPKKPLFRRYVGTLNSGDIDDKLLGSIPLDRQ